LELVARDLQLLDQNPDVGRLVVLHFRRRHLEQHDKEVASCEPRSVLNDLSEVVSDESDDVVLLVLLVSRLHHLVEGLAALLGA